MDQYPQKEFGIAIYPISKTISDYLCNSLGEVGTHAHPINYSGVHQILLSQWKYMKGMKSLYTICKMAAKGEVPVLSAQQAISSYNQRTGGSLTFKDISSHQLERPDHLTFSPQNDPWIFYRTKSEYSIYNLLSYETPNIPGGITEYERHFLPLKDFMEVLYIADWERDVLLVLKSEFTDTRQLSYDDRTTPEVKNRFNLAEGYYEFSPDFIGEVTGKTYVLSPDLEQNIVMEMTHPELV